MDRYSTLTPPHTIRQQYQRQQDQLSEIKLRMRELMGDYQAE
ncbi:hypothetical protein [Xenorhabdus stockiae]